jgi:hypothetical protein
MADYTDTGVDLNSITADNVWTTTNVGRTSGISPFKIAPPVKIT